MTKKKAMVAKDVIKIKKTPKKKEPEGLNRTYKGDLIFRRIGRLNEMGFNVDVEGLFIGKKVIFSGFLPMDFDITKHEITGSVTYKINIKKK